MLQGTSSFLVPRDTPGLTIARCNETLGCRFMNNGELVFEDMRVPEDHLLAENDALGRAGVYFQPGKIIQAAKNLGVGVRAFEVTVGLRAELRAGRPHPDQASGGGAAARRHGDQASRRRARCSSAPRPKRSTPRRRTPTRSATWRSCSPRRKSSRSRTHAVELHGGNGMMLDFGVEKLFRDAAIFPHMDGTTDISRFKIVKAMFPHTAGKYAGPEA